EASIDLAILAGFKPAGVLCELTNDDGSMARTPEVAAFGQQHGLTVVTIEDLVQYRQLQEKKAS
ncbi:3,4-dihydroxy-2-butanone-4-phosphate synthase, partial [Providencia alcalifaciens]